MSKEIDNIEGKLLWHWRDSMRVVRFFTFDARVALFVPALILYFRPVTIALMLAAIGVFYGLERYGLTFPAALRALRVWVLGSDRPGLLPGQRRRFRDYGGG